MFFKVGVLITLSFVFLAISAEEKTRLVKRQLSSTPTCGQPLYTGVVSENAAPGTFVLTAAASSPVGNSLTWSLQDTTLQKFTINPTSGAVSVIGSLARSARQRSALEFRIRATDNVNQLYCESTVRVNILPNAATTAPPNQPVYFAQSSYSFSPSYVQFGTVIGQVSVNNPSNSYVTYSISNSNQFSINPQSGQITANQGLSAGTYTFTVNASTQFGTSSAPVTVNVASGTGPGSVTFGQPSYSFITTSCGSGSRLGQVFANGFSGSSVTYSLSGTSQFTINTQTGAIMANGNVNSGTYTFNVLAQSSSGGSAVAQVTIQANCISSGTPPSFSQTSYTVTTAACTAGTAVARVQAGGSLPTSYSVSGTSAFSIDPASGQLTLNQNVAGGSYTFQIFATSSAGQATATVTVIVVCQATTPSGQYYMTSGSCPAGTQLGSICSTGFGK